MSVGYICNREVTVAEKGASIQEIANLMREFHVGNLVITEDREGIRIPIGIVTDRDIIIELIAQDIPLNSVTAGDVMSTRMVIANEKDEVNDAVKEMRLKGVRRMPVVNDQGALVGIVTLDDLIDLFAEQLRDLADLVGRERSREENIRN